MPSRQRLVKDLFDRSAASVLLVLMLPVFLLAIITIKLFSRGPVLFLQKRVGLDEKPFQILKFRTMSLVAPNHALGSVTVQNDPRLFRGAKLLRTLKIDELPQLINVLNGTMSLVGPRPTVEEDYQHMSDAQRKRASVKPGLTGLAQINGAAALLWPERIKYDLQYIEGYSLWLDASILAHTALLVLTVRADANPIEGDEWGPTPLREESVHKTPTELRRAA
jgi:undecaprenyl phosphate N,N'-diacetylbacillosamine 1-phosphate transferase